VVNKGEKTRSDIVNCAEKLFYVQGYERTSFTDIVESTDLSRGNIYHYFKSKDEILKAVIEQRLDEYRAQLTKWDIESSDAKERLFAFIDMIVMQKSELIEYGCPIGSLNTELAKDQRELQKSASALFDLFRDWLESCFIQLGIKSEAQSLALHLLGRAQGVAVISHVYRDKKLLLRETNLLKDWVRQLK
jgi:AcrR family transcriptional regulator